MTTEDQVGVEADGTTTDLGEFSPQTTAEQFATGDGHDPVAELLDDQDDSDDEHDGDPSRLPLAARRALATLLTSRFITRARQRQVWDTVLAYEDELRERLSDMFLHLVIDREYEVAFKRQDPREDAPKLLRRDKPISRDATILLLNLRKEHMYSDAVDGTVVITRTQATEFLRPFREEEDGDEARFDRRVDAALRALIDLRLLTPDQDVDYLYLVSPAVVPLVGVEEVLRLEQYFQFAVGEVAADDSSAGAQDDPVVVEPSESGESEMSSPDAAADPDDDADGDLDTADDTDDAADADEDEDVADSTVPESQPMLLTDEPGEETA